MPMFDRIFGWYLIGCEQAAFTGRVHTGMACLLAPWCEPREVARFIERARVRDECASWLTRALMVVAPMLILGVTGFYWMTGRHPTGWFVAVEFGALGVWTLWAQPVLMLQVQIWRAESLGRATARLVRHVQPYRVAQAIEHVQQTLYEYANPV